MTVPFPNNGPPPRGLAYAEYLAILDRRAEIDPTGLSAAEAERIEYTKLNRHRSGRIGRNWRPSPALAGILGRIVAPQIWLVLTEPWCGDSAQCLPCIALMAQACPAVDLRILLRDENPEVMDRFLTDGKRSIPLLAAFAETGDFLFRWGPRPADAQEVFRAAQAEGLAKPEIMAELHLWYGRDRGRAIDAEFRALLAEQLP